jgi:hypothetical protein
MARFAMRKRVVIGLVASTCLSIFLAPSHAWTQADEPGSIQDSEEYAVYSAVLNSEYASSKMQQFVITAETSSKTKPAFFGFIGGLTRTGASWPETDPETKSDFNAKNEKTCLLERKFDLNAKYVLVTSDQLHSVFIADANGKIDGDSWKPFYQQYPGAPGIIAFTRVGFNTHKDEALVYVVHQSGLVGGSGRFFVLSKRDKSWEIQKRVLIWLS